MIIITTECDLQASKYEDSKKHCDMFVFVKIEFA